MAPDGGRAASGTVGTGDAGGLDRCAATARGVRDVGTAVATHAGIRLTRAAVDVSGRPFLVFRTRFTAEKIGTFDTQLVREFFQALAQNAGLTLHIETLYGDNAHHIAETCFKAVARVLGEALAIDPRQADLIPSTKGVLA